MKTGVNSVVYVVMSLVVVFGIVIIVGSNPQISQLEQEPTDVIEKKEQ